MLRPGLVSISFRRLTAAHLIALAAEHGLACIEWGGDVHVPHGDVAVAAAVGAATRSAGLAVSGYGSYYRAGISEAAGLAFASVLASAQALGAPSIRVWAGDAGSATTDAAQRRRVEVDLARIAGLAAAVGVTVLVEHHGHTLTDTSASSLAVLSAVPALASGWQPYNGSPLVERTADLQAHLPRVATVHVFHWLAEADGVLQRRPLAEGREAWASCLALLRASGRDHDCLLEFVRGDAIEQLAEDAATLRAWLGA